MALVVQKFGGSSVRDAERVRNVAQIVTDTYKAGNSVVVVVSAQGDTCLLYTSMRPQASTMKATLTLKT